MTDQAFDLDSFFALGRLQNLHLSPDGSHLVLTVATLSPDGKRFVPAVWEVDCGGAQPPRRLTRSTRGETARGFLPDGSVIFTSSRADLEAEAAAPVDADALYVLPAGGGEARRLVSADGGIQEVLTVPGSHRIVFTAALHPAARTLADDAERERLRRDAGVQARLIDHYPSRFWDHPIGPRQPRLLALDVPDPLGEIGEVRDLTPSPPWAGWLEEVHMSLRHDGGAVAMGARMHQGRRFEANLIVIDTGDGSLRVLDAGERTHALVAWSPDGGELAVTWTDLGHPDRPPHHRLSLVDPHSGRRADVALEGEAHFNELTWSGDGAAMLAAVDVRGETPVLRVMRDGTTQRLTGSGAFAQLRASADGAHLYAARSSWVLAPEPVRLSATATGQPVQVLPSPAAQPNTGVRMESFETTTPGNVTVQSWLLMPEALTTEARPLALFVHGGPISAWSAWTWRWSAALLAARGWAVLLPNPRLSTGFGYEHIAAAWSDWAELPAADILAAVDAAVARDDVDGSRVAALGGSYGGYMVNWMAGHTDRFAAIVTHASVWDMFLQRGASDVGIYMDEEFGDPLEHEARWRAQSPHLSAPSLRTPTLVIHGERDDRVPIANALALWTELRVRKVPSRLLVFPDENHWILKPQNSRLWYQTVFAFLDEHVLGADFERPALL